MLRGVFPNKPIKNSQQHCFKFLDVLLDVSSDRSEFFQVFNNMYAWFKVNCDESNNGPLLEFFLNSKSENPWHVPVLVQGGEIIKLSDPLLLQDFFIYEIIFNSVLDRVRSHILLHAGALELAGKGLIIAGDSGHGKTTLTLSLLRQGFSLLSDEIAALCRYDHRIHPFPRSLRIRHGSLEKAGFIPPENTPVWGGKLLLDARQLIPGCIGNPSLVNTVILLKDPEQKDEQFSTSKARHLQVIVDHLDDGLIESLRDLPGALFMDVAIDEHFPILNFLTDDRPSLAAKVEKLCHENGILILEMIRRVMLPPQFNQPPRLEEIPKSRAVMELLRMYQASHNSDLLVKEYSSNPVQMFWELANFLNQARCYNLYVGELSATVNLIKGAVNSSG